MSAAGGSTGLGKNVLVSVITTLVVITLLGLPGFGIYYFGFKRSDGSPSEESFAEKIDRAGRAISQSPTDAGKVTSVSFQTWGHVGPLYPGPNEPPGHVLSDSVEFRRDLSAKRVTRKDYDRELPDESTSSSAQMTADQMAKLIEACVKNDIINQPDSKEVRSEAGTTLVIEYNGEKKNIVTSNIGRNTKEVAEVLAAIEQLKSSLRWTPASPQ